MAALLSAGRSWRQAYGLMALLQLTLAGLLGLPATAGRTPRRRRTLVIGAAGTWTVAPSLLALGLAICGLYALRSWTLRSQPRS